jgi:hypothetical protein
MHQKITKKRDIIRRHCHKKLFLLVLMHICVRIRPKGCTIALVPVLLSAYLHFLYSYMDWSQVFVDKCKSICATDRFSHAHIEIWSFCMFICVSRQRNHQYTDQIHRFKKLRWCAEEKHLHTILRISLYLYATQRNHSQRNHSLRQQKKSSSSPCTACVPRGSDSQPTPTIVLLLCCVAKNGNGS